MDSNVTDNTPKEFDVLGIEKSETIAQENDSSSKSPTYLEVLKVCAGGAIALAGIVSVIKGCPILIPPLTLTVVGIALVKGIRRVIANKAKVNINVDDMTNGLTPEPDKGKVL